MDFIKEFVLPVTLIMVIVIVILVGIFAWADSVACDQLQEINPDYSFRYDWPSGCKMQVPDGLYIHINRIQYVNGELSLPQ